MRKLLALGAFMGAATFSAVAEEPRTLTPGQGQAPQGQLQQDRFQQGQPQQTRIAGQTAGNPDGQPTTQHQQLQPFVGTWTISGTCMKDGPAEPCSGTVTSEWVLGNRFVKNHMRGMAGSEAMEGIGLCGYDTQEGKFVSSWVDNQCTSIKTDKGTFEPGTKTFTYECDGCKDKDGTALKCRKVIKIVSDSEHTLTGYVTKDGREQKVKELTFKKSSGVTQNAGQMGQQAAGAVRAAGVDTNSQQPGNNQSRGQQPIQPVQPQQPERP